MLFPDPVPGWALHGGILISEFKSKFTSLNRDSITGPELLWKSVICIIVQAWIGLGLTAVVLAFSIAEASPLRTFPYEDSRVPIFSKAENKDLIAPGTYKVWANLRARQDEKDILYESRPLLLRDSPGSDKKPYQKIWLPNNGGLTKLPLVSHPDDNNFYSTKVSEVHFDYEDLNPENPTRLYFQIAGSPKNPTRKNTILGISATKSEILPYQVIDVGAALWRKKGLKYILDRAFNLDIEDGSWYYTQDRIWTVIQRRLNMDLTPVETIDFHFAGTTVMHTINLRLKNIGGKGESRVIDKTVFSQERVKEFKEPVWRIQLKEFFNKVGAGKGVILEEVIVFVHGRALDVANQKGLNKIVFNALPHLAAIGKGVSSGAESEIPGFRKLNELPTKILSAKVTSLSTKLKRFTVDIKELSDQLPWDHRFFGATLYARPEKLSQFGGFRLHNSEMINYLSPPKTYENQTNFFEGIPTYLEPAQKLIARLGGPFLPPKIEEEKVEWPKINFQFGFKNVPETIGYQSVFSGPRGLKLTGKEGGYFRVKSEWEKLVVDLLFLSKKGVVNAQIMDPAPAKSDQEFILTYNLEGPFKIEIQGSHSILPDKQILVKVKRGDSFPLMAIRALGNPVLSLASNDEKVISKNLEKPEETAPSTSMESSTGEANTGKNKKVTSKSSKKPEDPGISTSLESRTKKTSLPLAKQNTSQNFITGNLKGRISFTLEKVRSENDSRQIFDPIGLKSNKISFGKIRYPLNISYGPKFLDLTYKNKFDRFDQNQKGLVVKGEGEWLEMHFSKDIQVTPDTKFFIDISEGIQEISSIDFFPVHEAGPQKSRAILPLKANELELPTGRLLGFTLRFNFKNESSTLTLNEIILFTPTYITKKDALDEPLLFDENLVLEPTTTPGLSPEIGISFKNNNLIAAVKYDREKNKFPAVHWETPINVPFSKVSGLWVTYKLPKDLNFDSPCWLKLSLVTGSGSNSNVHCSIVTPTWNTLESNFYIPLNEIFFEQIHPDDQVKKIQWSVDLGSASESFIEHLGLAEFSIKAKLSGSHLFSPRKDLLRHHMVHLENQYIYPLPDSFKNIEAQTLLGNGFWIQLNDLDINYDETTNKTRLHYWEHPFFRVQQLLLQKSVSLSIFYSGKVKATSKNQWGSGSPPSNAVLNLQIVTVIALIIVLLYRLGTFKIARMFTQKFSRQFETARNQLNRWYQWALHNRVTLNRAIGFIALVPGLLLAGNSSGSIVTVLGRPIQVGSTFFWSTAILVLGVVWHEFRWRTDPSERGLPRNKFLFPQNPDTPTALLIFSLLVIGYVMANLGGVTGAKRSEMILPLISLGYFYLYWKNNIMNWLFGYPGQTLVWTGISFGLHEYHFSRELGLEESFFSFAPLFSILAWRSFVLAIRDRVDKYWPTLSSLIYEKYETKYILAFPFSVFLGFWLYEIGKIQLAEVLAVDGIYLLLVGIGIHVCMIPRRTEGLKPNPELGPENLSSV